MKPTFLLVDDVSSLFRTCLDDVGLENCGVIKLWFYNPDTYKNHGFKKEMSRVKFLKLQRLPFCRTMVLETTKLVSKDPTAFENKIALQNDHCIYLVL